MFLSSNLELREARFPASGKAANCLGISLKDCAPWVAITDTSTMKSLDLVTLFAGFEIRK